MARAEDIRRLTAACEEAVKKFTAEGDATYDNMAADYIARCLGYTGFMALASNQIVQRMQTSPDFSLVTPEVAQKLANDGRLVIAGAQDDPRGHIAVCFPGTALPSSKWNGELAPVVANVGTIDRQKIWGANFAFGKEPGYWAWIG